MGVRLTAGRVPADPADMAGLLGRDAAADLVAGLTVTLVGLPQCLAYALMSGLPPAYGLSTAAVAGFVAAWAGKSPHVVTGPTNTTGLLVLAALGPYLDASGLLASPGLPALATLTLMCGLIRLAGAGLGLARLLRYLPESVLAGFTAGAGLLIAVMQLDEAAGLEPVSAGGLGTQLAGLFERLGGGGPGPAALALTGATALAIALGRRFAPRWPVPLLVIVGGAALGVVIDGSGLVRLVKDRAEVPSGWPPGALPSLDPGLWLSLLGPALGIVLLGSLELTVSARGGGARPDLRREIGAQGLANAAAAFASGFPASASLTRSALLRLGGGKSRLAAGSAAVFVVPVLFLFGPTAGYIPEPCLAGVLLVTAAGMVERVRLARIYRVSPASRTLMGVTLIGTLILPLEQAILLGSGLGLLIHLAVSAKPRIRWLRLQDGALVLVTGRAEAAVAEVSGTLFYAAVPAFLDEIEATIPDGCAHLVLDLSHAHQLRFSALEGIEALAARLGKRGVELALAGVSPEFERVLIASQSELRFTAANPTPGQSARAQLEAPR